MAGEGFGGHETPGDSDGVRGATDAAGRGARRRFPRHDWALVASAAEIEADSPGFMETVQRSAQMAASTSTSTSCAHQDIASTSRVGSSSTLIFHDGEDDDSFDGSGASD